MTKPISSIATLAAGAAVALTLAGTARAADIPAAAKAEADQVWTTRCVTCHGDHGAGDGPASVALNPKPRAFADQAWQKSVTDEQLQKVIVGGGPAIGKSPLMAANPDLESKPDVVKALIAKVRAFGQPAKK